MGLFDVAAFNNLLGTGLGTRVVWSQSHRCPCVDEDGAVDGACPVCLGLGLYWDPPSAPFRAGITGLSSEDAGRMRAKFGEAAVGDATLSLPANAPCYRQVRPGDRFLLPDATEQVEWVLSRRSPVRLPAGSQVLSAVAINGAAVVPVALPAPGPDGRISVARPCTVRMLVPRHFEVIPDLGHLRAWQAGLPQRFALKRIDLSTR